MRSAAKAIEIREDGCQACLKCFVGLSNPMSVGEVGRPVSLSCGFRTVEYFQRLRNERRWCTAVGVKRVVSMRSLNNSRHPFASKFSRSETHRRYLGGYGVFACSHYERKPPSVSPSQPYFLNRMALPKINAAGMRDIQMELVRNAGRPLSCCTPRLRSRGIPLRSTLPVCVAAVPISEDGASVVRLNQRLGRR